MKLTNQQRVISQILMEAGSRGVHSGEFMEARMPTFSQRIGELRASGWVIRAEPEKFSNGAVGRRYWFVSKPPMFPVDDIDGEPQEHRMVREQLAMLSEAAFTPAPEDARIPPGPFSPLMEWAYGSGPKPKPHYDQDVS